MTASEKETAAIRRFVCGELRDEPDLSTLTLGILKKRYLAQVGRESLSPEAKKYMKQVVEEELMKMQDNDENGDELVTKKRKREKENDEVINEREDEDESRAKRSRCLSSSSSESEDKEGCKSGSEESEEEDQMKSGSEDSDREVKKSEYKTNGNHKQQMDSEDSPDEEVNESEKKGNESESGGSPKEMVKKKVNATQNGEKKSRSTSPGRKTPQSGEENETDTENKSERRDKVNGTESSDDSEKEEKVSVEKKNNDTDSDSSSLPSLEDNKDSGTEDNKDNEKKKTVKKKEESTRGPKTDDKAVVRLKRYISLCGVKRNYKKLLDGCRSVRSMVAVLKKELEELGVHGQPSIQKCKIVRMKREEAQELAELDVSNIIATKGRPKRRGAWTEQHDPPSPAFQRTLNSSSDIDQENDTHTGRRRATDWSNLQGIISDDADSD
ncbi:HIRA-interacting protein 3 [Trachinotus anak]|uniref:HIRA-interacting protein 3 n=1 Tax=Trachinotus anak TaxID=443729 RepID=UPI0039F23F25